MSELWNEALTEVAPSSVPLYQRVYAVLREEIAEERYASDAPMPSEAVLAARFGVSRITIRKTFDMLVSDGLVVRRHGVGTFAQPSAAASGSPRGFVANLAEMWAGLQSRLLVYESVPAPQNVARLLELERGGPVLKAVRLRSHQDQPVGLLTTFIPERVASRFDRHAFMSMPLIGLFKQVGEPTVSARQRVTARSADPFAARHLQVELGSPLLCMMRLSSNAAGRPVSYLRTLYRPDRYEIELDLEAEGPAHRAIWGVAGD